MLIASPAQLAQLDRPIFISHFSKTITEYRSAYLLSRDLMMFVGTCEITRDDGTDHDDAGDDKDDTSDVAVITAGGR